MYFIIGLVLTNVAIALLAIQVTQFFENRKQSPIDTYRYGFDEIISALVFSVAQFVIGMFVIFQRSNEWMINSGAIAFAVVVATVSVVLTIRVMRGEPIIFGKESSTNTAPIPVPTPSQRQF